MLEKDYSPHVHEMDRIYEVFKYEDRRDQATAWGIVTVLVGICLGVILFLTISGCTRRHTRWVPPAAVSDYQQMHDYAHCEQATLRDRCMHSLGYIAQPYFEDRVQRPDHPAVTMSSNF